MTPEEAINHVNTVLRISGAFTVRGDEIKCYVASDTGPDVDKAYLDAGVCASLSVAFERLADALNGSKE